MDQFRSELIYIKGGDFRTRAAGAQLEIAAKRLSMNRIRRSATRTNRSGDKSDGRVTL
jgi:hypothetical protein